MARDSVTGVQDALAFTHANKPVEPDCTRHVKQLARTAGGDAGSLRNCDDWAAGDLILKAVLPCDSDKNSFSMAANTATGSSSMMPAMMPTAKATAAEWEEEGQAAAGATMTAESQGTRGVQGSTRSEYSTCGGCEYQTESWL